MDNNARKYNKYDEVDERILALFTENKEEAFRLLYDTYYVSIRPRACFFPLFSFLPLWLHYNLNPLCVQY